MTNNLTVIFTKLADIDSSRESLGEQILAFLVKNDCKTVEEANEHFGIAYDENGWSRMKGRPKEGATEVPAPPTVKNYVTTIRRGYAFGLDVLSFKTIWELRTANQEAAKAAKVAKEAAVQSEVPPALVGVQIAKEDELTGDLGHDLVFIWRRLPEEILSEFEEKLERLKAQFERKLAKAEKEAAKDQDDEEHHGKMRKAA